MTTKYNVISWRGSSITSKLKKNDRTVFKHLLWRYRSAVDCHRGRGSGCSSPGYGIRPLGGGHH